MSRLHKPQILPPPSAEEQALSDALVVRIREEIGLADIPFSRFMELALYAPGLGYYSGGSQKFGAHGDYVTAPELSPLYARCLAHSAAEVLQAIDRADVLEAGAGDGTLAVGMLAELARLGTLPQHYYILELSAELRERQARTLAALPRELRERVQWLEHWPTAFRGMVIGNELLDAMPVERFRVAQDGVHRIHVGWREGNFVWRDGPVDRALSERVAPLGLAQGYHSEVGWAAEAWIRSLAEVIETGVVLLVDYGFPRAEFYHPDRAHGTLMCHYRHRAHTDPLIHVGLQDITAHVDFSAIAEAAHESGLDVIGYTSQGAFLLTNGITEMVAASDSNDTKNYLELTNQVKKLTLPHEMGELFKVIGLARSVDITLRGFSLHDRRARL